MAISQHLQTKVILSAQDRGVSVLLNKLSGEANATVDQFAKLGSAMSGILGGITSGYAIKKSLEWIDDYKMSVLSIATTLTDTMRNSGLDLEDVFSKNKKHAEDFFRLLQKESSNSLSSLDELMNAYTMLASFGRALTPTDASAKMLANVVDRIKLATRGQNQEMQVLQELRAIMNGQARPSDALAKILKNGNVNFQEELQKLVAGGASGNQILEYINKGFAQVDIYKSLNTNLSMGTKKLMSNVKLWVINSFEDIYDDISGYVARLAESIDPSGGDSAMKRALSGVSSSINQIFTTAKSTGETLANIFNSSFLGEEGLGKYVGYGKTIAEILPRLTVMLTTVNLLTKAFSALKAVLAASLKTMNYTLAGQITALTALYMSIEDFARNKRTLSYFDGSETFSHALDTVGDTKSTDAQKEESWDYMVAYAIGTWDSFKALIATVGLEISRISSMVVQNVTYLLTLATGETMVGVSNFLSDMTGSILNAIGRSLQYLVDFIVALFRKIYNDIDILLTALETGWNKIGNMVKNAIDGVLEKTGLKKLGSIISFSNLVVTAYSDMKKKQKFISEHPDEYRIYEEQYGKGSWSRNAEYPRFTRQEFNSLSMSELRDIKKYNPFEYKLLTGYSGDWAFYRKDYFKGGADRQDSPPAAPAAPAASSKSIGLQDILYPEKTEYGKELMAYYKNLAGDGSGAEDSALSSWLRTEGENLMYAGKKSMDDFFAESSGSSFWDTYAKMFGDMQDKRDAEYQEYLSKKQQADTEKQEAIASTTAQNQIKVGKDIDTRNKSEVKDILDTIKEIGRLDKVMDEMDAIISKESPDSTEYSIRFDEINRSLDNLSDKIQGSESTSKLLDASTVKLIDEFNSTRRLIDDLHLVIKASEQNSPAYADAVKKLNEANIKLADQIPVLREAISQNTDAAKEKAQEKLSDVKSAYGYQIYYNSTMNQLTSKGGVFSAIEAALLRASDSSGMLENIYSEVQKIKNNNIANGNNLTIGDGFKAWLSALLEGISTGTQDIFLEGLDHLKDTLSDALFNLITTGKADMKELMTNLANSLVRSFTDKIADLIVNLMTVAIVAAFLAKGGVFSGGFTPLKAFSKGGIANRPTIGLVGEAGQNEAVVPLPDGRAIPVVFSGEGNAGAGNCNVIVNLIDNTGDNLTKTVEDRSLADGSTVIDIIIDAAARNRRGFRSAMKTSLGIA